MKNVNEMMLLKLQKEDQILKLQQEVLLIDRDIMNVEIQEQFDAIAAERQLNAATAYEILAEDMHAPVEDEAAKDAEITAEIHEIMKVIMKNKGIPFGAIPCGALDPKNLASIFGGIGQKGELNEMIKALKSGKAVLVKVG